jgi:hypothetical protein
MQRKKPSENEEPVVVFDEAAEVADEQWDELAETLEEEPVEAEPEPEPQPDPGPAPKISTFMWRGQTRYRCSLCPYDSADESEAYKHYQTNHVVVPKGQRVETVDTGLVGPTGDRIIRVQEVNDGTGTPDPS